MIDEFCEQQLSDNASTLKSYCRIGNAEVYNKCTQSVINGINRNPEFEQLPHNVQAMYNNNGRRNAVRRRVHEYVQREVRQ